LYLQFSATQPKPGDIPARRPPAGTILARKKIYQVNISLSIKPG
jgi:hypothetical protein